MAEARLPGTDLSMYTKCQTSLPTLVQRGGMTGRSHAMNEPIPRLPLWLADAAPGTASSRAKTTMTDAAARIPVTTRQCSEPGQSLSNGRRDLAPPVSQLHAVEGAGQDHQVPAIGPRGAR